MSKLVEVVAAIILQNDRLLIAKRPVDKPQGGYWEFPGGKIENKETARQALARELMEELNIRVQQADFFMQSTFAYPEKKVCIKFYWVEKFTGEPRGLEGQMIRWVDKSQLADYQFPEANHAVLMQLRG